MWATCGRRRRARVARVLRYWSPSDSVAMATGVEARCLLVARASKSRRRADPAGAGTCRFDGPVRRRRDAYFARPLRSTTSHSVFWNRPGANAASCRLVRLLCATDARVAPVTPAQIIPRLGRRAGCRDLANTRCAVVGRVETRFGARTLPFGPLSGQGLMRGALLLSGPMRGAVDVPHREPRWPASSGTLGDVCAISNEAICRRGRSIGLGLRGDSVGVGGLG